MAPVTIIFVCVAVIAVLEISNLIARNSFLNKPVRIWIILICLGLIVYFNVDRGKVSENESANGKADSLENEVRILHSEIDSLTKNINRVNDSNRTSKVIIQKQKETIHSTQDTSTVFNKKVKSLTDALKVEFHQDVQHCFSKYSLPADYPIDIICRTGDDNAYDFAEKLSAYLKSSGYNVEPIVNKMQLRSKKSTSFGMNVKEKRVEINIGSGDITPANPIIIQ